MAIVEVQPHRVVANRLDVRDGDAVLACLQHLLTWSMSLHLRGGGEDPQILGGIAVFVTVIETDFQNTGLLMQVDLGRIGM